MMGIKRNKFGVAAALAAAAMLTLGACSSGASTTTDDSADAAATTQSDESGDVAKPAGGKVESVALLVQDVSNPFFGAMKKSLEDLGAKEGFTVNTQDSQQDIGMQTSQIDALVQQKVDIILLNSVDTDGVGPAVQRAIDAGVVVVGVDVDGANAEAVVSTDNTEAGRLACKGLFEKIGGKGNVLIINGTQITSVQERITGCYEVLEDYPDITVVGDQAGKNDVATGQQVTTDLLTANPDVQGIFGCNDPTARGAVLALQQANRTGVWVTGVDGSPEAVEEMLLEDSSFWGSAAQDPGYMVERAFEVAKDIFDGNPPAERIELITPEFIDRDNVKDYPGWVVK